MGDSHLDIDTATCPLCGGSNDCQRAALSVSKDACKDCWCHEVDFPPQLLDRVPPSPAERCICRACLRSFQET